MQHDDHPALIDRSTYPSNNNLALLHLVRSIGGTGITLQTLIEINWFGTRTETTNCVETFTTHDLLDTIETGVPGEKRTLVIPGEQLTTATDGDLQFTINVLFD